MLGLASSPTRTVYDDVTLTRSKVKVKVTDHLNFRQLPINVHFQVYLLRHFRVELKLTVDIDSMGRRLQLLGGQFSNFLLGKVSLEFKLHGMSIFHDIQMATYFGTAWCYSHVVGYAGSLTYTVYVDVTLTPSKVKVTVLLNFRQLAKPCMLTAMTPAPCGAFWFSSFLFFLQI